MSKSFRMTIIAAGLGIAMAGSAAANVTFQLVAEATGNGCTGQTSDIAGFVPGNIGDGSCTYNGSPAIVKYDGFNDSATYDSTVVNTKDFSQWVDTWITFSFTDNGSGNYSSGTWKYNPVGVENPIGITAVYFKAGNGVDLYESMYQFNGGVPYYGGELEFAFNTGGKNVSNVVFFDTIAAIPVPAALPLLTLGLFGLGYVGHRQRKVVSA